MWLVIVVGLGILILPLIIDIASWIMIIGFAIILIGWFFHAVLWLLPFVVMYFVGQWLIDKYYLRTGKGEFWASKKLKARLKK
ncbi:hypothetical protein [Liquorilactobacillus satsumensis]|uniref:Uncharacterized protein n=1 Tax=Liquorilactobacillus satsumensis DSM 16230 = JCM 12392 TaxID=1423801 RepID=A0A0R1V287_9LACO|nr:hypothetical protein [Liquorilactobacillus satsumensis]KRL99743.1 hypothetical protein FD50_GL000062 [Liquorilactobacillus satsumensis DSM 16230 = JCM 12392]